MKSRLLHHLTVTSLLILSTVRMALAQPGDVDLTFKTTGNSGHSTPIYSATLQPDGRMVLTHDDTTATARINANGSADPTFASVPHGLYCAAVQADGKLLIATSGLAPALLSRYDTDGTLDPNFDAQIGLATGGFTSLVRCLVILDDGSILIGGRFSSVGSATRNGIARLRPDGTLDPFFNPVVDPIPQPSFPVRSMAAQPDGKVVMAGDFTTVGGMTRNHLARLNNDGSLDNAFDPQIVGVVTSVALQPDGKLVIGGTFSSVGGTAVQASFVRLNADGSLDASFAAPATVVAEDGSPILLQTNGQMLVAGANFQVTRLNADGSVDGGFTSILDSHCNSLTMQADGKVVLGGLFSTVNAVSRRGVARVDNDLATQALSVPDAGRVRWQRGGASPEAQTVSFELSTDGGGTWMPLGVGARIANGWELTGLSLPAAGTVRARARTVTGYGNGSSSLLETVRAFTLPAPPTVTTLDAVDPSNISARLAAIVNPNGSAGTMHFEYGTDAALAGASTTADLPFSAGVADLSFSQTIGELTPASQYYYRVVATNGHGTALGDIIPFATTTAGESRLPGDVDLDFIADLAAAPAYSVALQPDGKMVVEGYDTGATVRLNPNGGADAAFGAAPGGYLCMAIQADGGILLGNYPALNLPLLHRLHADGTPDPDFDVKTVTSPAGNEPFVRCIAIQNDGKILIGGGFSTVGGVTRNGLARLQPDGTLDPVFNPNVDSSTNSPLPHSVRSIAVQPDRKVVIVGAFTRVGGVTRNYMARLNADGSLDSAFDPNIGRGSDNPVSSVALQPDGKFVIGGDGIASVGGIVTNLPVVRLNADGTLDASFSAPVQLGLGGSPIILQANGQMLISGAGNHVLRLNANGSSMDQLPFSALDGVCESIAVQADGKVVIGGLFTTVNSISRSRVARLENDLATQALSVPDGTRVRWERGGTSPEAQAVSFELSTDGGGTWTLLGFGARIAGGWQLTGLNLPSAGTIRARARTVTGYCNGSSSLLETVRAYVLPAPPTVTTLAPPFRSLSSAQFSATVNPNGINGTMHFEYSADPALADASSTFPASYNPGTTDVSFSYSISGLAPASTYYYRAVATSANGTTKGDIVAFTTIGVPGDLWRYQHFGAAWQGVSFAEDGDGDGVTNLAEYAFGGDPRAPDAAAVLPKIDISGGHLRITFTRDPAHTDIASIIVQASNDLVTWTDLAQSMKGNPTVALVSGVTVSESALGARLIVQVTDNLPIAGQPLRALRVKISLP